jgi:hypothetical protein
VYLCACSPLSLAIASMPPLCATGCHAQATRKREGEENAGWVREGGGVEVHGEREGARRRVGEGERGVRL